MQNDQPKVTMKYLLCEINTHSDLFEANSESQSTN